MARPEKSSARRSFPARCTVKWLVRRSFLSTPAKGSSGSQFFLPARARSPGPFFVVLALRVVFRTKSTALLPLPGLSHSINLGYVPIRFFESLPGAMRMSEPSKRTTQAAPPDETYSLNRAPTANKQALGKNTLRSQLEKRHERQ